MNPYGQSADGSQSDPVPEPTGSGPVAVHGEADWPVGSMERESYPERPEEADCIYYLRTGFCGYGSRCRFNHPRERSAVLGGSSRPGERDLPERLGQPVCQYYMKTGMCKFGASCKYNHPQQEKDSLSPVPVPLNFSGYPLRPGEKECSYYLKNGQCKFGATCKFHHPERAGLQFPAPSPVQVTPLLPMPLAPSAYPPVQSPSAHSSQQYGVILARPPMLPTPYVQSPYGPMLVSPGFVQFPSWSPYPAPMSPVASPSAQPSVGSAQLYGVAQISPSASAYAGSYQLMPSAGPSSTSQKESFPERPGQPECQYYMRTGDCKFGSSCRYHHPSDLVTSKSSVAFSQIGLPLRPGAPPCTHFMQRGMCKFGTACKFDHSVDQLSYSPSTSSLADMPVAPYPVGSVVGTLAPSSSSSELRPENLSGSRMEYNPSRMSSSMSSSSGLISSTTSRTETHSHSSVQQSSQSSGQPAGSTSSTASVEGRT